MSHAGNPGSCDILHPGVELGDPTPFSFVLARGSSTTCRPAHVTNGSENSARSAVASFPGWHWLKGPIRKFRYEPDPRVVRQAGFSRTDVLASGKAGYLVRADR